MKELYEILSKKIKQSLYIEKRLEIIFELTNEEINYWLTGTPFKFHEDIKYYPTKNNLFIDLNQHFMKKILKIDIPN